MDEQLWWLQLKQAIYKLYKNSSMNSVKLIIKKRLVRSND